jgi:nitrite reductase/ring-hydroxylating ferredoxin subunit
MAREKSWQDALPLTGLLKADATPVTLGTREIAIFDTSDGITAAYARCTHGAANLCDGYFNGTHIECPLHQGLFDARTGAANAAPARVPLRMIEARVQGEMIQLFL